MNKSFFKNVFIFFALFVKVVKQYATEKQKNLENIFFRTFWTLLKLKEEAKSKLKLGQLVFQLFQQTANVKSNKKQSYSCLFISI